MSEPIEPVVAAPGSVASTLRIAVHDYAGHPFQFELSRALAHRGHTVRHFFFGGDRGPKGAAARQPDDNANFSVEAIELPWSYSKARFVRRFLADQFYARRVAARIAAFRPDVVLSGNTPLDVQAAIARTSRRCGAAFVFWVQDFYSVAMARLLASRWSGLGRLIARRYAHLERGLLCRSQAVVLISPDFRRWLPRRLARADTVVVIRNWGALRLIGGGPRSMVGAWAARNGVADRFVFMYTGTLALKHDPRLLLALADAFATDRAVLVVVIASGVNADALGRENAAHPRPNLVLLPLQPTTEFGEVLASADVLVSLLESEAGTFSVPSKLLNYLCANRPILLSGPPQNLASRVLAESDAGISCDADDTAGFLAAAQQLRAAPELRTRLGANGRAYAERNFGMETVTPCFEATFSAARARLPSHGTAVRETDLAR